MVSMKHLLLTGAALLAMTAVVQADDSEGRHVLLISVDGMHHVDLQRWIDNPAHTDGGLARLASRGKIYSQAYTTAPSDSFPGIIAQVTGGTPFSTGVFYDDSYERTFYAPGSNCAGAPGAETTYAENIDKNPDDITAGGTLGQPLTQINPDSLPMRKDRKGACVVVWPHEFIRVNTIFEVFRAHKLHTAWSDKHPAYEILNGPSGTGIEDLYTPEINSQAPNCSPGNDNTKSFSEVRAYDLRKVDAIINQIDGKTSTGAPGHGVPAIFGMNFQAVSVGQKLKKGCASADLGLVGGYADAAGTPNTALATQLQFVDDQIKRIISELKKQNIFDKTAIVVSAKHGQSPIDGSKRVAIPDTYSSVLANDGYGFNIADDASLIWLDPNKRTPATLQAAMSDLVANSTNLGIQTIFARDELKKIYKDPQSDSRTPDFFVKSNYGVVYTTGSKLAEHGGLADDDRHVALLISAKGLEGSRPVSDKVFTTQIAPTILRAFDIDVNELQSVKIEGTRPLP